MLFCVFVVCVVVLFCDVEQVRSRIFVVSVICANVGS